MNAGAPRPAADHFSAGAPNYRRYRPGYPAALFRRLAELAPARGTAWDCGTGNGQAALPLAGLFERVVATDISASQLRQLPRHQHVEWRRAAAEDSGLASASVDLVTVAQALHWFDRERFYAEVRRVLRPGGVVAAWTYLLLRVTPEIDRELAHFHDRTVSPFWPPERAHVVRGYADLDFPFERIRLPAPEMRAEWDLEHLLGYLGTWSATRRYRERHGHDPVAARVAPRLRELWGPASRRRTVRWPLCVLAGRGGNVPA